jgi:hypothetical protein
LASHPGAARSESAAVVDLLFTRGLITAAAHRHAHGLLIRVSQMLTAR